MLREIEGEGSSGATTQSNSGTIQQPQISAAADVSNDGEATTPDGGVGEEKEDTGTTIMTPAQKKAAKKEREKKKKEAARQAKQAQQNQQERATIVDQEIEKTTPMEEHGSDEQVSKDET